MSYALIALGAFLEVYYYSWRFSQDGIPLALAIVSGVALTVFLIALSVNGPRWLFVLVVCFSVLTTSAGQHTALGEQARSQATEDARASGREQTVKDLEAERARLLSAPVTLTQSLWARERYQDQAKDLKAEKETQEARLITIQARLEELRAEKVASLPRETVYQYYGRVTGWPADWIEIALQTILSVFFALMAPTGMRMLKAPRKDWGPLVEFWYDASMVAWKAGQGRLTPKASVLEFAKKREVNMTGEEFDAIAKAGDGVNMEVKEVAVKKILLTLNRKPYNLSIKETNR